MNTLITNIPKLSFITRYRFRLLLYISLFWTFVDGLMAITRSEWVFSLLSPSIFLRLILVFIMSMGIGYVLIFQLRNKFRNLPLWNIYIIKTIVLLLAALLANYIIHAANLFFIHELSIKEAVSLYGKDVLHIDWLAQKIFYWIGLFVLTQLIIEVNEKYSPGVFFDLFIGKYKNPRIEKRIVMFIDLKDSTPLAEKLGHEQYFKFIREFIFHISNAIIEFGGTIYQYVGDEVVVSWPHNRKNAWCCIHALIEARKNIQEANRDFEKEYGFIPEFRAGVHAGDVTVGEIGVVKKDIAMSGDTMNTTARIRSITDELHHKFIVSKEFMDSIDLKSWQAESLGLVELKGKEHAMELYYLKV